jgi:hypothetical protein
MKDNYNNHYNNNYYKSTIIRSVKLSNHVSVYVTSKLIVINNSGLDAVPSFIIFVIIFFIYNDNKFYHYLIILFYDGINFVMT